MSPHCVAGGDGRVRIAGGSADIAGGHRGLDRPRTDRVHANVRSQLHRHRFGQRHDSALGGDVGNAARAGRHQADTGAMFTIVPFPAFWISGAAAWITRKVPVKFTARVRENTSAVVSAIPVSARMPAALMTPSSPPNASAALLTAAVTDAGSDTSQAIATAPISSATAFAALSDRSRIATAAPSLRNSRAVARPIPDAPPVMMILRPASRAIFAFLFDPVRVLQ